MILSGKLLDRESELCGENTVIVLGAKRLLFGGVLAVGLGGVDVEIAIDVRVENGVLPIVVDADVVNASLGTRAVHPCPTVVAMKFAEGTGQELALLVDELDERLTVVVVVFRIVITNETGSFESNTGIGVDECDELDVFDSASKPLTNVAPPFVAQV